LDAASNGDEQSKGLTLSVWYESLIRNCFIITFKAYF